MAIPPSGYPTTLDDTSASPGVTIEFPQPGSGTDLDAANVEHDILHSNSSIGDCRITNKKWGSLTLIPLLLVMF